jgi:hypothetical protein
VPPDRVVEAVDVIEHIGPGLVPRAIELPRDLFALERREEAFHRGVVTAVAGLVHRAGNFVVGQQPLELLSGILAALVRVMQHGTGLPRRQLAMISASVTSWAVLSAFIVQPAKGD